MKVVSGHGQLAAALGRAPRNTAIAIGNFDGVHRGHQALLAQVCALATADTDAGVLTFDPHPARFFRPELAPPMIMPLERRLELFAAAGLGFAIVEPFDRALADLTPEIFVREFLASQLNARQVVVGYDFSFGRGRAGDTGTLTALGQRQGIGVTVVPAVKVEGVPCSSTKIREFVLEGRVEGAALLLGRPFEISGPVVRGAARGRTIGYPTANVRPEGELLPRTGIYAGRARVLDGPQQGQTFRAAISVGTNPTFTPGSGVVVEAYLLDYAGDLYDHRLRIEVHQRLRDEQRFASVDALVAQIADDVARTRKSVPLATDVQ